MAWRLTPDGILAAYREGVFPMADPKTREIQWFRPDFRAILPLDEFHVPRSLARTCRAGRFEVASDGDFEAVIDGCAARRETWISAELRDAYVALHRAGHAHSVEARVDGRLAGGLYGVHIGGAFMGESMFHLVTDASKVCLAALVGTLRRQRFALLDTQMITAHLQRFGAVCVPHGEYVRLLGSALRLARVWTPGPLPLEWRA